MFSSSTSLFRTQKYITTALMRLNYNEHDRNKSKILAGVCAGSAMKAIEHYLLEELNEFETQLSTLHSIWRAFKQECDSPEETKRHEHLLMTKLHEGSNPSFLRAIMIY